MFLRQHADRISVAKFHLEVIRQLLEMYFKVWQSTFLIKTRFPDIQQLEQNRFYFDQGNARLTEWHFSQLVPRKEI